MLFVKRNKSGLEIFVKFFIGFVFFCIVCYLVGIGIIAYKAIDAVQAADTSQGVKPLIEKFWCGKAGCLSNN